MKRKEKEEKKKKWGLWVGQQNGENKMKREKD